MLEASSAEVRACDLGSSTACEVVRKKTCHGPCGGGEDYFAASMTKLSGNLQRFNAKASSSAGWEIANLAHASPVMARIELSSCINVPRNKAILLPERAESCETSPLNT